jgi:hypothetical protein
VPGESVRVCASRASPENVGAAVLTGGAAGPMTWVAALNVCWSPTTFWPVTRALRRWPSSAALTV